MMAFEERLRGDLTKFLKSGEQARADFLRFILAQIHNQEIEKRGPLSDDDVAAVLRREAKKRKESIEMFRNGGRDDLARHEEEELGFLSEYLPPEISKEEIERVVNALVDGGLSDFTSVIKEAMKQFKNRADGKIVQEIIKKKLAR